MKQVYTEKWLSAFPKSKNQPIDWLAIEESGFRDLLSKMKDIPQNPLYHGEGNVLCHTKAVCESLVGLEEFGQLSENEKSIVFLAALLHDIGKINCTVLRDGVIVSPHHASVGVLMARAFLWERMGLAGSPEKRNLRESVCFLIKYHFFPPYAMTEDDGLRKMLSIASNGELAPDFSLKLLYILEKADILGRICPDRQSQLERVEYFKLMAEEAGCLCAPHPFKTDYSERGFFKKKTNWQDETLFSDTWGEVILLSALPATGKDTYIAKCFPKMDVISLDDIRRELDISPTENQGKVIAHARELARQKLRKKQPFVFNATNITAETRQKQVSLFEKYGASVKIIFLETDFATETERNQNRQAEVPASAIAKMLTKLEIPERHESEKVLWEIT